MANSSLLRTAQRVTKGPGNSFGIKVIFLTPTGKVEGRTVLEFVISNKFFENFTGYFEIQTMVSMVDLRYNLFPNRDNLQALVQFFPIDVSSNSYRSASPMYQDTYRVVLLDNFDGGVTSASPLTAKREVSSVDEEIVISAQLVEVVSEKLSYKQGGGIIRFSDGTNIIKTMLGTLTADVLDSGQMKIEMYPISDVAQKRDAVVIPHYTRVLGIPAFIQEEEGGVYAEALGSYIVGDCWWIFPLFKFDRFTETTRRLKIIQLGNGYPPISDRTWEYVNGELTIVCASSSKMQDTSVAQQMNYGQGTRFMKATATMDSTTAGDPNKEHFNQEETMAEFTTGKRADGNNVAWYSDKFVTDNIANEYSKIAFRKGQVFATIWQQSMARLIHPGMPVRVYYDRDDKVVMYDGTVLHVDEVWTPQTQGMVNKTMTSTAAVVCFINKEEVS